MIVRDSERTLGECLSSIAPWVDEMIIVDTGSVDKTRELARELGGKVFEFPWCDDFSAARNESLSHATGDWLFWMDSDDTISAENGQWIRTLADDALENAPMAYVMQVHCPGPPGTVDVTFVDHIKMFRNDDRLRFEGRIHEQILPAIRRAGGQILWTDAYVVHSGSEHTAEAKLRKQQRDLRLLEIELAEKPEHPFVLFNLGMTYADMQRLELARENLERCLAASATDESHLRKAYALLAGTLVGLGRYEQAEDVLQRGLALYKADPELSFRMGIVAHRMKKFSDAIAAYECALAEEKERRFSSRDQGITGYKARHNLALVYSDVLRHDLAELQWRLASEEQPRYADAWTGLVDVLLAQRKFETLQVEIEMAKMVGAHPFEEIAIAEVRLVAEQGDPERAMELIADALRRSANHTGLMRLRCQLLYEQGSDDEALVALETLCRLEPTDGASWHNLGTLYHKKDCTAQAITCYQKSLKVRPDAVCTLLQLGHAQLSVNRTSAARRAWEAAQRLAPDDPAVISAFSLLEPPTLISA